MTETADTVIKDAYELLIAHNGEEPLEDVDAQAGIRWLNRMMDYLYAKGIDLGYTDVENISDTIVVPAGSIVGIISNLAVFLHPTLYKNQPISPILISMANEGMQAIRNLTVDVVASQFPDTLPRGSGQDLPGSCQSHFYTDLEDTIMDEFVDLAQDLAQDL